MPYEIREEGGRYCVYKQSGEKKECYDARDEAEEYMKALSAAEDETVADDKEAPDSSLGDGDPDITTVGDDDTKPLPPPTPVPARKSIVQRVIDRLRAPNTAFKMAGNHFLITWSNNFEDRDGELFTEKAIDAYVSRVDLGMTPLPELWVWHAGKGVRIGQAEVVGRHGHFVVAAGQFDDTSQAQRAKAFYEKHQRETGVSHGFTFPASAFDGRYYHDFNTFEISLLPKAVAANPFTNLEQVKEGMKVLTESKRDYLRKVFGDEADRVLETLEESGKALEDMQAAYKDFTAPDAAPAAVSEQAVKETETSLKELIPDLLEGQAEVFKMEAAQLKALKDVRDEMAALTARVVSAETEAQAAKAAVAAIASDLPRRPSTDAETVIAETQIPEAMKNSMKQLDQEKSKFFGVPVTMRTP